MKTILVTGANGQLGNSIRRLAAGYPQYAFVFTDVDTLDICDAQAVNAFVKEKQVDYIINCAAYTAVDKAEDDEALCLRINRDAVRNLGEAARMAGARVIHVSTDYVFDGTNHLPYVETDNTCPASVYGRTKLAGEQALQEVCPDAVIIRTAWLYSEFGNNFVKTMLRLGNEREQLSVVFDQIGSPTYAGDLAAAILRCWCRRRRMLSFPVSIIILTKGFAVGMICREDYGVRECPLPCSPDRVQRLSGEGCPSAFQCPEQG